MPIPVLAIIVFIHLLAGVMIAAIMLAGWRRDEERFTYGHTPLVVLVRQAVAVALFWELALAYLALASVIEWASDRFGRVID